MCVNVCECFSVCYILWVCARHRRKVDASLFIVDVFMFVVYFSLFLSPSHLMRRFVCISDTPLIAGGYVVPPPGYFKQLRKLCDDNGIFLIADEVCSFCLHILPLSLLLLFSRFCISFGSFHPFCSVHLSPENQAFLRSKSVDTCVYVCIVCISKEVYVCV